MYTQLKRREDDEGKVLANSSTKTKSNEQRTECLKKRRGLAVTKGWCAPGRTGEVKREGLVVGGDKKRETERSRGGVIQGAWHYSNTRQKSSNRGNVVYFHFSVDDADVNSLHVTFTDREDYGSRVWAMRTFYTPTYTTRGSWSPLSTNMGNPPQAEKTLANNNLGGIRGDAITYAEQNPSWSALRAALPVYVNPVTPPLPNQWE